AWAGHRGHHAGSPGPRRRAGRRSLRAGACDALYLPATGGVPAGWRGSARLPGFAALDGRSAGGPGLRARRLRPALSLQPGVRFRGHRGLDGQHLGSRAMTAPHVVLRPLETADRERLLAWRNLPEIARWMYSDHKIGAEEHARW